MADEWTKNSGEGQFSKVAFAWLCGSFAWLAVSGVLGIVESVSRIIILANGNDRGMNSGVLTLARSGAFNYGWAGMATIALLLYCIRPHAGHWEKLMQTLAWCWSACIAVGISSILSGNGTGMATMPFAPWVFVPLTAIAWIIHFVVWSDAGERGWRVRVPALTAFAMICTSLGTMCMADWGGVGGMIMMACVRAALIGSAVTIALAGLWRSTLVWREKMMIPVSILLILIPLLSGVSGMRNLEGMPVPWQMIEFGKWGAKGLAGVLLIIGVFGLFRIITKGRSLLPTVRFWLGSSLVMMVLWGGVEFFCPGGRIFETGSAGEWYIVELMLFCTLGLLLRASWHLCLHGKVSWGDYAWGSGCLFLWITWALHGYASVAAGDTDPRFFRQALSEGVAFASIFSLIAWIFFCLSAVVSWTSCLKGEIGELIDQSSEHDSHYFSWKRGWLGIALVGLISASLAIIDRRDDSETFVKRSGVSLEGSRIYAGEGCGVCHSQMIKTSPLRTDLQREIDESGIVGGAVRESEPEDYSPLMKEGAAHAGWVSLGPDLSHLQTRLAKRLSYEDSAGHVRTIARTEEWIFLHMYNPRERLLKTPWSSCPSLSRFFRRQPIPRTGRSSDALPVQTPSGYEIVPTLEAKALASYLTSLSRGAVSDADGTLITSDELARRAWHEPGVARAQPDVSKTEWARKRRELSRGKEMYLAKCSVCHGVDGGGDAVNYPPLKDSEWISGKDPSILADIMKNGLSGSIRVRGKEWNSTMLPPGVPSLEDMVILMNYLRATMSSPPLAPVTKEQAMPWWEPKKKD